MAWANYDIRTKCCLDTSDIFLDLFWRTINEQVLSIDTANKSYLAGEVVTKPFGFHISRFCLDWVKSVDSKVDQIRDYFVDCSAGVKQYLVAILVADIGEFFEVWANEFIELIRSNEQIKL